MKTAFGGDFRIEKSTINRFVRTKKNGKTYQQKGFCVVNAQGEVIQAFLTRSACRQFIATLLNAALRTPACMERPSVVAGAAT